MVLRLVQMLKIVSSDRPGREFLDALDCLPVGADLAPANAAHRDPRTLNAGGNGVIVEIVGCHVVCEMYHAAIVH